VVVLDESIMDSQIGKLPLVVGLQEKPPRIADDIRPEFPDPRKRGVQSLQVSQYLAEEE
jgi:hypothetical protein